MPELICAADDPQWLAERRKGVTASDIPVILGLTSWGSPYGLWWDKTSPDMPERADNDRFRLGRELESYVIDRWQEEHEESVSHHHGLYRSPDRAWQMATLDAKRLYPHEDEPLEVKTWADADKSSWEAGPPPAVRAQVLWQMDVMDVPRGHVGVVFLPSGEFRSYVVELCGESCGWREDIAFMREAGYEFYRRMTGELPAPDVDGSAATLAALRARFTRHEDKTAPINLGLWNAWYGARVEEERWKESRKTHEALIRLQLGEAAIGTVNGEPVLRRIISDAHVKAQTRHQDYIRSTGKDSNDD